MSAEEWVVKVVTLPSRVRTKGIRASIKEKGCYRGPGALLCDPGSSQPGGAESAHLVYNGGSGSRCEYQ